jgi:hypothetical protein
MAGLVDACSSADDHAHPDDWSGLAAVHSGFQHQSFFPAADRLLDHAWNFPPHPFALGPASALAWRTAGRRRCSDDFAAGVCDRPAGKLFHLPLSAGDHRRKHLVLPAHRLSHRGGLFSAPRGHDRTGLRGENSADLLQLAHAGKPAFLAGHESFGFSCGGLSGQPLGAVTS